MSGLNSPGVETRDAPEAREGGRLRLVTGPLSALSFWGAIALPALYLPFLVVGIERTAGLLAFLGLLGLHLAALAGGRDHRRA